MIIKETKTLIYQHITSSVSLYEVFDFFFSLVLIVLTSVLVLLTVVLVYYAKPTLAEGKVFMDSTKPIFDRWKESLDGVNSRENIAERTKERERKHRIQCIKQAADISSWIKGGLMVTEDQKTFTNSQVKELAHSVALGSLPAGINLPDGVPYPLSNTSTTEQIKELAEDISVILGEHVGIKDTFDTQFKQQFSKYHD